MDLWGEYRSYECDNKEEKRLRRLIKKYENALIDIASYDGELAGLAKATLGKKICKKI
jgi:hypothetical protein